MINFFRRDWAVLILIIFTAILVTIWFFDKALLATGENALMFANPQRSFELYNSSWFDAGPGQTGFARRPLLPTYFILKELNQTWGIQPWVLQSGLFYGLILTGMLSTYFLIRELFKENYPKQINSLAFLGALFYFLNPVSLLGVWYRFIYEFMFFFALAPLFFYLFLKGFKKRDYRFVFLTSLLTIPLSVVYGSPALIPLIWFLPGIYTFAYLYKHRKIKNNLIFPFIYFGLTILFWVLLNSWWIVPQIDLFRSPLEFAGESELEHGIGTLKANSKDFSLINVIRLIHGGFLYRNEAFGPIYKNPVFIILSFIVPSLVFIGLIKLKDGFLKWFLGSGLLILIFLAKGTSEPFGGLFLWLFEKITPLQLYRNPLEKFGLLLPVVFAPLFAIGVWETAQKFKGNTGKFLTKVLAITMLAVFCWPFFSGAISHFNGRDIRVVVPDTFNRLNNKLSDSNHRILNVPILGASGRYKWKYDYAGLESSEYLYKDTVFARVFFGKTFYDMLLIKFIEEELGNDNIIAFAQLFSADLIALRKDTDLKAFGVHFDAISKLMEMIQKHNLDLIFDSNEVSVFRIPDDKVQPEVFTPTRIVFGQSPDELLYKIDTGQFNPKSDIFICQGRQYCSPVNFEVEISGLKIDGAPAEVTFNKISPTLYRVKINESPGKFMLVLSESYNPGWDAYIDGKPVEKSSHIVANGYANGFLIEKDGNFDLELKFSPAERDEKVLRISLLSAFFGILSVWILTFWKGSRSERKKANKN